MGKIIWSPQMELGIPALDSAHKAFVEELARVATAPNDQFGASFFPLIDKLEREFAEEEELMEEIDFPALNSHREQHARVLGALHHVVPHVMNGDTDFGRQAIEFLHEWFTVHLSTMDMVLALAVDMHHEESRLLPLPVPQSDENRQPECVQR